MTESIAASSLETRAGRRCVAGSTAGGAGPRAGLPRSIWAGRRMIDAMRSNTADTEIPTSRNGSQITHTTG